MDIETRLAKVERNCIRLRLVVVCLSVCIVAVCSIAAVSVSQNNGRIQLIEDGKPRLIMSLIDKEPCLTFYNKKGDVALTLGSNEDGTGFCNFYGADKKGGLELKSDESGGVFLLYDSKRQKSVALGVNADGGATLNFFKPNEKKIAAVVGCVKSAGELITVDSKGNTAGIP